MKMDGSLFDNIIDTAQDCIFWKDKNRRFVGANQAFLDFYGFESIDEILGKTDEDMGWHNDPAPFMQDEMRVLEGESTYKVLGKCMVRGEERDIIASKRPIYGGNEIIGLVGSFSDVTDVMRRKNEMNKAQVMYSREQLRKYSYFDKLIDEVRMDEILDSLTGIVSRAYILDFAKALIAARTPFTFCIIDLDNFKYINDTYGHHAGDCVLMDVSKELANYTDGYGVAGRFGGDELILINLRDITFEEKTNFFEKLYEGRKVLRKIVKFDNHSMFVTGTSGCATYPDDARNYEELFSYIDKTLYHGKSRGRNCYTIYVEAVHRELEIKKIAKQGVYTCMSNLAEQCEHAKGFLGRLRAVMPLLKEQLQISDLYYAGQNGRLHSVFDEDLDADVSDLPEILKEDLYSDRTLDQVEYSCPKLYSVLNKLDAEAVLIVKIGMNGQTDGYLVCAEPRTQRIWQEDECGIMYFLAKILAANMRMEGEQIPQ